MADHQWPAPIQPTSLSQGQVIGIYPGRSSSEIIVTVADDGVAVLNVGSSDIVQSWAFQKEGCEPAGPACFQKNGGVFCIPMHVSESCATSTRRSKKTSSSVQSFLYVWSMADVDSKNIRHVSTKVELSSSVRHVLPLVCNPKKIAGDRQSLKKYSSGFLVITNDGEAYILDTETSTLHGVDLPTGSTKILSASCNENGFDLAYTVQHGKTNDTNIFIATFTLAEYPSVRLMRIWRLDTDEAQDGALMSIECRNRRAIALFSNGLTLIYHTEEMVTTVSEDSKLLMPVCVRHLRLDSVGAQPKGRKRGHTGFPTLDGDLKVSIDNFSRAFIFRHDHKSLIKIITVDLLYGSILWSGCIERETSAELISQAFVTGETSIGIYLAIKDSRVIQITADVPKVSLSSVVGSMCIQNNVRGNESAKLNKLALHAKIVLDPDSQAVLNESKRLGKVTVQLHPGEMFGLVQPVNDFIWKPSIDSQFEEHEKKLASILRDMSKEGSKNSKSKTEFLKAVALGLEKCKKMHVSFSGELSARLLATLIEMEQWDSIGNLLRYSHPKSLSHCPGAAASLASSGQYVQLLRLLGEASDISPLELYHIIKTLVATSGPDHELQGKSFMSSLASNADKMIKKAEKVKSSHKQIELSSDVIIEAKLSAATINGFSQKQVVCHPLLALYPNPILITTAMKKLHSQYLIFLIQYLLQWLSNIIDLDVIQGGSLSTCEIAIVPSLDTVIKWLTAAVDAGNLRLSTTDKGVEVLESLSKELQLHVKCLQTLGELTGILQHLQKPRHKMRHRNNNTHGLYSAECLSFS